MKGNQSIASGALVVRSDTLVAFCNTLSIHFSYAIINYSYILLYSTHFFFLIGIKLMIVKKDSYCGWKILKFIPFKTL